MPLSDLWSGHDLSESDCFLEPADAPESADIENENRQLKKKLQTCPARAARAVKRASRPDQPGQDSEYAERLQSRFFTHLYQRGSYQKTTFGNEAPDVKQQFSRERARCIWSFLQALKGALLHLFQNMGICQHAVNIIVADDTNTTLKAMGSGRNTVHTVMNTVQAVHFRYLDGECQCLHVPTPMCCLSSGKALAIHRAFTSWLVLTASGPGMIWKRLGCPDSFLSNTKWRTTLLMGDALRANDKAWRCDTAARLRVGDPESLGMRLRCSNHQLCLVRKPTVLSVERMWSTIVRLGHLYETQSFRRTLAAAFVKLLQKEGAFVRNLGGFQPIFFDMIRICYILHVHILNLNLSLILAININGKFYIIRMHLLSEYVIYLCICTTCYVLKSCINLMLWPIVFAIAAKFWSI